MKDRYNNLKDLTRFFRVEDYPQNIVFSERQYINEAASSLHDWVFSANYVNGFRTSLQRVEIMAARVVVMRGESGYVYAIVCHHGGQYDIYKEDKIPTELKSFTLEV